MPWPNRVDQLVERTLAAGIPFQPRAPHHLHREQMGLFRELRDHERPKRFSLRRPTDPPLVPFRLVVNVTDRYLILDAADASYRHSCQLGHFFLPVAGASQYLDLVTLQHVDHPFPRCSLQRVWPPKTSGRTGQNFRKR